MVWNESKHPRDDIGRFTYSDGSNSESNTENNTPVLKGRIEKTEVKSPAEILYGDTYKKEKAENEYRSKLLNILGNLAKPTDVLYGTAKQLEEKVKEYGLEDKLLKISFIEGKPTGFGINNINQENTKNNSKEYVKPTTIGRITSPYGDRMHPVKKVIKKHDGIDIGVPIGTPVGAVSNGKVTYVGKKTGYGNYIEVQYKNSNGDNITTFYAHLNDFKTKDGKTLKVGQTVKQGEQIGHSGNTGIGTGAHLHLGARKNGKPINPIDIIGNVYPKK